MIRAMLTAFPEEPDLYGIGDQYMLGDALLVKPVTQRLADGGGRTEVRFQRAAGLTCFRKVFYQRRAE